MDENKKIPDEELEKVSGGMIFDATGRPEADPFNPWEVLNNDNCEILARFPTRDAACEYAKRVYGPYSYNYQEVDWDTVQRLRANPNTY
ncbi:MAG: hypothetical protein J5518_11190 [Lachnospiraceae bacterium]|nr:hypothetical protein [Lachnospiraceae bacterium]